MTRIACTAITGRIMAGRVNRDGNSFIGTPKDVTSDVLKAIVDKLEHHGGQFEISSNGLPVAILKIERLNPHLAGVNQGVTEAGNGGDA